MPVVCPPGEDPDTFQVGDKAYTGEGVRINSGFLNGSRTIDEATTLAIDRLESLALGGGAIQYRSRDWVIATPKQDVDPKHAEAEDFVFSMSFCLAVSLLFDGACEPVQTHALHVSSAEGYVRHLLDVRVLAHALNSVGLAINKEPIPELLITGAVAGEIDLREDGSQTFPEPDTIRIALLANIAVGRVLNWQEPYIHTADRLLSKLAQLPSTSVDDAADAKPTDVDGKLSDILNAYRNGAYHKAISFFHELSKMKSGKNKCFDVDQNRYLKDVTKLLEPIAPRTANSLWATLSPDEPIENYRWPRFVANQEEDVCDLILMINGKKRGSIRVPSGAEESDLESLISQSDTVEYLTKGQPIARIVHVPNRLINLVLR
jgi:leucyl-tRNA synthetase